MEPIYYNVAEIEKRVTSKSIGENVCPDPQISIVVPAYNVAEYIAETLDSAFEQTFKDFELIIVNDGSPDTAELRRVLEPYLPQIIYIEQQNRGAAGARNTAIRFASADYIAFLDADDIWLPEKLERQLKFIRENDLDLTYCDALMFGEPPWNGKRYMESTRSKGAVTVSSLLSFECNFITSGTICKKENLIKCGCFDEERTVSNSEDFDLWIRLVNSGCKTDYQKIVLLKYRVILGSLSGGSLDRVDRTRRALERVREVNQLSADELKIIAQGIEEAEAQLELERAKLSLIKQQYEEAQDHLRIANQYYRKMKYSVTISLLGVCPGCVAKVFRFARRGEYSFIDSSN